MNEIEKTERQTNEAFDGHQAKVIVVMQAKMLHRIYAYWDDQLTMNHFYLKHRNGRYFKMGEV